MAVVLPFSSDNPISKFSTTLDGVQYGFRARWNSRDEAWYVDISDAAGETVATGVKVSLGVFMGRSFNHPLFRDGVLVAVDLSGQGKDPTIDDFGTRVQVLRLSVAEVLSLRVISDFPDPTAV